MSRNKQKQGSNKPCFLSARARVHASNQYIGKLGYGRGQIGARDGFDEIKKTSDGLL